MVAKLGSKWVWFCVKWIMYYISMYEKMYIGEKKSRVKKNHQNLETEQWWWNQICTATSFPTKIPSSGANLYKAAKN